MPRPTPKVTASYLEELGRSPLIQSTKNAQGSVLVYLEAHPEEASYLSAREIAKRCNVSDSTVIRAVQTMGYEGFPKYQEWLRKNLAQRRTTVERFSHAHKNEPLAKIFSKDIENIKTTWEAIPKADFSRAAKLIAGTPRIWLLGLRMAHSVAVILKEGLVFLGFDVRMLLAGNGDFWDEAAALTQNDVIISIGLPRYTRITIELTEFARFRGAHVIAITNGPHSPLTKLAEISFDIAYGLDGYIESYTAAVSFAQALLVGISNEKGKEGLAALEEKEKLWMDRNVYY